MCVCKEATENFIQTLFVNINYTWILIVCIYLRKVKSKNKHLKFDPHFFQLHVVPIPKYQMLVCANEYWLFLHIYIHNFS